MQNNKNNWLIFVGITAIVVAGALVIISFMQGESKTSGSCPENAKDESINCTANNIAYPYFEYDNSDKKETTITVIFSNNKLKTISLAQSLYYADSAKISASDSHNHAAMNKSFAENGLGSDALSARYSKFEDKTTMYLYATKSDFNNIVSKYFFIDGTDLNSLDSYQSNYENQGFVCIKNE